VTRLDRWLGGVLIVSGLAIAGTARGYTVGFAVDPVGPRVLPYLVTALFLLSGGALLLRKGKGDAEAGRVPTGPSLKPQVAAVAVLLLYAGLILPLGFIPPTVLATGTLAKLFGGRWARGLAVGLALSLGLYGLFALGFGLELPMGTLFQGGR
jgi:putative tricarboxylic transport membrane protein